MINLKKIITLSCALCLTFTLALNSWAAKEPVYDRANSLSSLDKMEKPLSAKEKKRFRESQEKLRKMNGNHGWDMWIDGKTVKEINELVDEEWGA